MKFKNFGDTNDLVSLICLGTMTWGEQNTEAEAHEQLDYSFERGVNFIDTAEMYPVPPKEETYTKTEEYIGRWSKLKSDRDKIFLATKIAGPGMGDYIRGGGNNFARKHIEQAIDASLKRLNVECIDLMQLHWPERSTNFFGQRGLEDINKDEHVTPFAERLTVLGEAVKAGKIRHIGVSNETPWGVMKYLEVAKRDNLPRIQSIQNPYNLLNRSFEVGNTEVTLREKISLLAYSPLAFGVLTGKYRNNERPQNARLTLYDRFTRYLNPLATEATEKYCQLAEQTGVSPTHLALAFVNQRPFMTSNIIGATTMEQLKQNIDSIDIELSAEMMEEINKIHTSIPNPSP
jgi:aryl-alcohol dehydrogenase-like predicted oxidoreductase